MPEHDDLRRAVSSLVRANVARCDVRTAAETPLGYSEVLWTRLNTELGVSAMLVPTDRGGEGFTLRDMAVVLEEAGANLLPEPILMSSVLAAWVLSAGQVGADSDRLIEAVASGGSVGAVCLEPGDVRVSGGVAQGRLPRVMGAKAADIVVFRTSEQVLAVEARSSGVRTRDLDVVDTTRRQGEVLLDGAEVVVVSEGAEAARLWTRVRRLAVIAIASEHLGVMRHQLDATVEHARQRRQFGRPIGSFQVVKHRLADVLVDLERSRSAVDYAAALFDEEPSEALAAEIAGAVTTEAATRTAYEAIQLHGGIGFTWEHPAHLYLRRLLGDEGLLGSARQHRGHVADLVLGHT